MRWELIIKGMKVKIPTTKSVCSHSFETFKEKAAKIGQDYAIVYVAPKNARDSVSLRLWELDISYDFSSNEIEPYEEVLETYEIY